jgi:excisionase family DNA binding protein
MKKLNIDTEVPAAQLPQRLIHSVPQSRERLGGLSRSSLYELIARGELELVKIGRRSFITEDSLQRFVSQLGR